MQIKFEGKGRILSSITHSQNWLVMKLTTLFLTVTILQVSATGVSQNITYSCKNASLESVFTAIKKQSGFVFFYRNDDLARANPVTLNLKNVPIMEALEQVFNNQPLNYSIKENTIVVSVKSVAAYNSAIIVDPVQLIEASPPIDVYGRVTSESGEQLEGATVLIKGTNKTTITNKNGEYFIKGVEPDAVLVFSYSGLLSREIGVKSSGEINVSLKPNIQGYEAVVVVGYGTQKKANLTGAVDQVGSEHFEDRPMPNIARGLQGVLPNLNIRMTDGKPTRGASYNIRGATSIGQASAVPNALVLIDGVTGDPDNLNPNDIESVTVLKDAASAAIYGARGAFGVVLITTKSPKTDKISVSYSANYSINQRTTTPDLVTDGYTWAKNYDEAFFAWNDYLTHPVNIDGKLLFSQAYLDELKKRSEDPTLSKYGVDAAGNYAYYGSTDWMQELYNNSNPSMEHALSVSGGTERVKLSMSARYYYQDGVFRYNPDKLNKYNVRIKGSIKVNEWLSINANLDYSNSDYKYPLTSQGGVNAVWRLLSASGYPVAPLLNPDGTLTYIASFSVGDYYQKKSFSQTKETANRNTFGFVATPIRNVTLKGDFSYLSINSGEQRRFFPATYSLRPGEMATGSGLNYLEEFDEDEKSYITNLYGEYATSLEKHNIKLLVGGNLESYSGRTRRTRRDGLLVDNIVDWNLATGLNYVLTGGGNEWSTAGLFYRANYAFDSKYLFEFNGRYDGSSRFPEDKAFGFFPSASVGWVISKEKMFQSTRSWLDQFKVRASYGSLGNGNINPYSFTESVGIGTLTTIVNGRFPNYIQRPNVFSENISWEKSTTLNIGTDMAFLQNRLNLSFDWYQRKTTDMITVGPPLPVVFGATVPNGNNADLMTKGWELSLNWRDKIGQKKPLTYSFRVAVADNVSTITKFYNPTNLLTTYYVGYELGQIMGFETVGFFKDPDDVAKSPNQKNYFQVSPQNNILPGDIKFADLNGDGFVNIGKNTVDAPGDRRVIGNTSPRYPYSFMGDFDWNNFSLSFFFQGVGKRDWMPSPEASYFWGQYNRPYSVMPTFNLNRWTPDNPDPNAYFPRYRGFVALSGTRELAIPQTRYLQDVSYIRLKNLSLGYSLPRNLVQKIKANNIRIYVTGQNLWTYSSMFKITRNFDPEVIEGSDPELTAAGANGGDGFLYPMQKSYTIGLNVTF